RQLVCSHARVGGHSTECFATVQLMESSFMKVIIAGGGTGGHLFPGIAVAREIERRRPGSEILFVGAEQGIETRLIPQEGFALRVLPAGGVKRVGWKKALRSLAATLKGLIQARRILKEFQPSVVIG